MIVQRLTVLGSTGSIGVSTLDVVARHPERFRVFALSGFSRIDVLAEQCLRFRPAIAVTGTEAGAAELRLHLGPACGTDIRWGAQALIEVAAHADVDTVMAAIVGAAGLPSAFAAAEAGKRILLANKEALVIAGEIFMSAVRGGGSRLLPIDSEHNAIFQSLPAEFDGDLAKAGVRKLLLTASGGPFRLKPASELASVSPEQACKHPNWSMGRKISVDSATLMNKGLEVIEARWLFNAAPDDIQVVVHPQSVIHSLVQYNDGSVLAQLGNPDMRTPIAHALGFPERLESGVASLDLFEIARLDFERPDAARFPCLELAYRALRLGGNAPAILNAANEVAVDAFLNGNLGFTAIPQVIAACLDQIPWASVANLDDVLMADQLARTHALHLVGQQTS